LFCSDSNYYFITSGDGVGTVLEDFGNIHGANDLCAIPQEDACYTVYVGGGRYSAVASSTISPDRTQATLCEKYVVGAPSKSTLCMTANGTQCEVSAITNGACPDAEHLPMSFVKLDAYGDGWGTNAKYTIKTTGGTHATVYSGTLADGEFGIDSLCLKADSCYTLAVTGGNEFADEIVWMLCGFIGGAPVSNQRFCVTSSGCEFQGLSDDEANRVDDDDFVISTHWPSLAPVSSAPTTNAPSTLPTLAPTLAEGETYAPTTVKTASPTHVPTAGPTLKPTSAPSAAPTTAAPTTEQLVLASLDCTVEIELSTDTTSPLTTESVQGVDMLFVDFAVRRLLEESNIKVWAVSSTATVNSATSRQQVASVNHVADASTSGVTVNVHVTIVPDSVETADYVQSDVSQILQSGSTSVKDTLQVEVSYAFNMCKQQHLMNDWIDTYKVSSPTVGSVAVASNVDMNRVDISTTPPSDNGYSSVYPNPPSSSNYTDLHYRAILVIVGVITICMLLLVSIRCWISRAKRGASNMNDMVIDFDSPRATGTRNPMFSFDNAHTGRKAGGNSAGAGIEMGDGGYRHSHRGYGRVQSVDTDNLEAGGGQQPSASPTSASGTRTKYSRNISDRLMLRGKSPPSPGGRSPSYSLNGTALDVSTRDEVTDDGTVDEQDKDDFGL
jgi:hypothetical protein